MALVILESRGFCATTAISDMLAMGGRNAVSHGVQNFANPNATLTDGSVGLDVFLDQMRAKQKDHDNCIAVHCLFPPEFLKSGTSGTDIRYLGMARRDVKKQVLSCFYWNMSMLLNGEERGTRSLGRLIGQHDAALRAADLPLNFISYFMYMSLELVLAYNARLVRSCAGMLFMEDFLKDTAATVAKLELENCDDADLTIKRLNSHSDRVKENPFLDGAPALLDQMAERCKINARGAMVDIETVQAAVLAKAL